MRYRVFAATIAVSTLASAVLSPSEAEAQGPPPIRSDLQFTPERLIQGDFNASVRVWSATNARQAYAYTIGYAYTYQIMRDIGCNVPPFSTPFQQFFHFDDLLNSITSRLTGTVTPNNDTIYSVNALNLDAQPLVFTAPEALLEGDRYWVAMLQDGASNVPHLLGSENTGPGDFVIAWNGWEGPLPTNLPVFEMSTPFSYLLIRTGVSGPDDVSNVVAIQDQYRVTPLSEFCAEGPGKSKCKFKKVEACEDDDRDDWRKKWFWWLGDKHAKDKHAKKDKPKKCKKKDPEIVVQPSRVREFCQRYPENFSAQPQATIDKPLAYWEGANVAMNLNPPPSYESALLQMYKDTLVGPDGPTDFQQNTAMYDPNIIEALSNAPAVMVPVLEGFTAVLGITQDGWSVFPSVGDYGNIETGIPYDYRQRGVGNIVGPGGLPVAEAKYFLSFEDGTGAPLDGANTYELTLDPTPPVGAFWSVTLYEAADGFFYDNGEDGNIDNDIYSIGTTSAQPPGATSVTITMSHSPDGSPPAGVENWLPAPNAEFYLALRTYVPLDPDYFPPPVIQE